MMRSPAAFVLGLLARYVHAHGAAYVPHGHRELAPNGFSGTDIDYSFGETTYQGYLSLPAKPAADPPPGVIIAHQWMGLTDYEKSRADEMAANGYVAFAIDVYGKGNRCTEPSCATQMMNNAKANVPKLRSVINAGVKELIARAVNTSALVAMGYCFGGSLVLELARHPNSGASAGVTFLAVSTLHGVLSPLGGEPAAEGTMVTHVQAHHAAKDYSGDAGLLGLEAELKSATKDTTTRWQTTKYGKCEHGWSQPGTPVYRPADAMRAHLQTFAFFDEARRGGAVPNPFAPMCREEGGVPTRTLHAAPSATAWGLGAGTPAAFALVVLGAYAWGRARGRAETPPPEAAPAWPARHLHDGL